MADAKQSPQQHEDDVIGKAYDGRLMRRLLTYLRPYRWQVGISLVTILFKAGSDILGPYLTKVAVDLYMTPGITDRAGSHRSLLAPLSQPGCLHRHNRGRRDLSWPRWCSAIFWSSFRRI